MPPTMEVYRKELRATENPIDDMSCLQGLLGRPLERAQRAKGVTMQTLLVCQWCPSLRTTALAHTCLRRAAGGRTGKTEELPTVQERKLTRKETS